MGITETVGYVPPTTAEIDLVNSIIRWDLAHSLEPNWWYVRFHFAVFRRDAIDSLRADVMDNLDRWYDQRRDNLELPERVVACIRCEEVTNVRRELASLTERFEYVARANENMQASLLTAHHAFSSMKEEATRLGKESALKDPPSTSTVT